MPEIILPTKQQVEGIKQDTEFIKSQFPISGGTDWRELTTQRVGGSASTTILSKAKDSLFTITGNGIISDLKVFLDLGSFVPYMIIDGGVMQRLTPTGSDADGNAIVIQGSNFSTGTASTKIWHLTALVGFKTSFEFGVFNTGASNLSNIRHAVGLLHQ